MEYWFNSVDEYLKTSRKPWLRSLYAPEVNPWVRRGEIEAALLFRGAIVSSYGYIDTRLAELAIRTSRMVDYEKFRSTFPFSRSKRISYLRAVFQTGVLAQFQKPAESFLRKFEATFDLRDVVAHARMEVLVGSWVNFEHYPSSSHDGTATYHREPITLDKLESFARRMGRLSRLCQTLSVKLEETCEIPVLHAQA